MLQLSSTLIAEEGDGITRSAVTVFNDITDRRKEERRLRDQVNRDPLTGLLNRREFERLLEAATNMTLPKARAHVLLFLDLDGFKAINDRYGHDVGDRVLLAVSRLLRGTLLPSDEIARWGGDEFAAILYFRTPGDAVAMSQRMIDTLSRAPDARGVGASIGVVPIARGKTAVQLMHEADKLMYEAKAAGRNRVVMRRV
jgi:diguanylate cyclase (GGDEF)-like protein